MKESIVSFFSTFPAEMATFFLAMIPVTELRASIPIAITIYHFHPLEALFWSILGNMTVGVLTLFAVEKVCEILLLRVSSFQRIWQRYRNRLHRKNSEKFERWGAVALVIFIAIPLPMTGVITGAIVASIFQVPPRNALPLLFAGVAISGVIVTLITVGVRGIL